MKYKTIIVIVSVLVSVTLVAYIYLKDKNVPWTLEDREENFG